MTSDSGHIEWRTGSFCDSGACVEVGFGPDQIYLRNAGSEEPVLAFSHEEWTAFLRSAGTGEFDL